MEQDESSGHKEASRLLHPDARKGTAHACEKSVRFPFHAFLHQQPHDNLSLVAPFVTCQVFNNNGTHFLTTTATKHPQAKPSSEFLRSEILLGVNLMEPVPGQKDKTKLTTISHVKTSCVPSFLSEPVAARSAIDFIKTVNDVLGSGSK